MESPCAECKSDDKEKVILDKEEVLRFTKIYPAILKRTEYVLQKLSEIRPHKYTARFPIDEIVNIDPTTNLISVGGWVSCHGFNEYQHAILPLSYVYDISDNFIDKETDIANEEKAKAEEEERRHQEQIQRLTEERERETLRKLKEKYEGTAEGAK